METEKNRLIAEFMNKPYDYLICDACGKINPELEDPKSGSRVTKCCPRSIGNYGKTFRPDEGMLKNFQYHTSYDWLMPVVEKIEATRVNGFEWTVTDENAPVEWQFSVEIRDAQCVINRDVLPQYSGTEHDFLTLYDCRNVSKIEAIYTAVIQFIQWYNNQPLKK